MVADHGDLCGECPVWDDEAQHLYWIDCVGMKFSRYDWRTSTACIVKAGIEICGFRCNLAGGYVVTNSMGAHLWDGGDRLDRIPNPAPGPLNDCTADPAGRLITESYFYAPGTDYALGNLILIDNDGSVKILDEGYHLANGLGFSPDGKTLYAADSVARRIYAYQYDVSQAVAWNRRMWVQVPAEEGIPDGLAVDADGFVWSAQWYGASVVRYDPDGKMERRIALPAKQVSSVCFGGPDLTELFITTASKSEPMPVMPPGYDPDSGLMGGALYVLRTEIRGQRQMPANIGIRKGAQSWTS